MEQHLPDSTRLRGDINVLLLGDPSTAKSQFLKFIEKVRVVLPQLQERNCSLGWTACVNIVSKTIYHLFD